jgi:hypothetical protein
MKKMCALTFPVLVILLVGCKSPKEMQKPNGVPTDPIGLAISDFMKTRAFKKKDSVYSVAFRDTLFRMVLTKLDNGNAEWIPGKLYDGIIAVRISASNYQFLLADEAKVGSKGKLPSKFIVKNGKLFYWWDNNYPLTQEMLDILKKYDLFQDNQGGLITIPINRTDDSQKGSHYYFCREDLSKFKRIVTNIGMGYYDPPNLNCSR